MVADQIDWSVYVIVDPDQLHADSTVVETARAALTGGARVLQLRDGTSSDRQLFDRAESLGRLCERAGATFVVNDRLDVALAAGADGVHLGPEDLPVDAARSVAPNLLIGGSAGDPERATRLQREGVDYIGCGAIYDASPSKEDASGPRGPSVIRSVVASVSVPVLGIGGIGPDNAGRVVDAGADGVAVIRAVCGQSDPGAATEALREAVRSD